MVNRYDFGGAASEHSVSIIRLAENVNITSAQQFSARSTGKTWVEFCGYIGFLYIFARKIGIFLIDAKVILVAFSLESFLFLSESDVFFTAMK